MKPRMFPREIASQIVFARMNEAVSEDGLSTYAAFAQEMVNAGISSKAPSVPTIRAILGGTYYPDLTLPDGSPVDWSKVPVGATSGRRTTDKRGLAARMAVVEAKVDKVLHILFSNNLS